MYEHVCTSTSLSREHILLQENTFYVYMSALPLLSLSPHTLSLSLTHTHTHTQTPENMPRQARQ